MSLRLNIGCGRTPTKEWRNYDNSWSVRLARTPRLANIIFRMRLLSKDQREFISVARSTGVLWADAAKHIPEIDGSVDVIYSSHMIEHLDRDDVIAFLSEARRVLRSGGVIRIAVPNLRYHVDNYISDGDADRLIERTHLTKRRPRTLVAKMMYLIVGDRNHQWMYDGESLCKVLGAAGFREPRVMKPGTTTIGDSGELDLKERIPESVFAEGVNP